MFIIIFAVSISIWFHNWSEHRHEQADVKKFLLGLREDLYSDISEMNDDLNSYQLQSAAFNYVLASGRTNSLRTDSLKRHANYLYNTTGLVPNSGRFEGFKTAGKIGKIENDSLQNNILDLYQENIPSLLSSTNFYTDSKKVFFRYLQSHLKRTSDSTSNATSILAEDEALNIVQVLTNVSEITERYNKCISKMKTIITEIEDEYGLPPGER
jgi:hypothetical protein